MLVAANNLHEYFREALSSALLKTSVNVTQNAQAYLVYLLSEFTRSENVYAGVDPGEKPAMALLLLRANESEPEEALRIFKHMGDSALYLLGFFNDAVQSEPVGPRYYIGMGETAYSSAANLSRTTGDATAAAGTIYAELSDRFSDIVNLLKIISLYGEHPKEEKDLSSEKLYGLVKRYNRTKCPEVLEVLRQNGVNLAEGFETIQVSAKKPVN